MPTAFARRRRVPACAPSHVSAADKSASADARLVVSVPRYGPIVSGVRVGEIAERAGVNVETLRCYERRGLLPTPERTPRGHRRYDEESVLFLRAIRGGRLTDSCPAAPGQRSIT